MGWYGSGSGAVTVTKANLEQMLADWAQQEDPEAPGYHEGYWSLHALSDFAGRDRVKEWLKSYDLYATFDEEGNLTSLELGADKHPYGSPEGALDELREYADPGSTFVEQVDEGDGGYIRHRLVEDATGKRWIDDETVHTYGNPQEMSREVRRLLVAAFVKETGDIERRGLVGQALTLIEEFRSENDWRL